ncbi:MAG: TadE/TadG family type IV pilus assembly protein [Pseudomonadota bacterium]
MLRKNAIADFRRDERGATAIEFAFVAPVMIFALLSLVEIGVIGMMSTSLDNAVITTSRMLRTGRDDAPVSAEDTEIQICRLMGGDYAKCRDRLVISVQKYPKFANANAVVAAQPAGEFARGVPGDIVVVKANYRWPLMTPFLAQAFERTGLMEVTLGARVTFKNEPYA